MKRDEIKEKIPGITEEQLTWLMAQNGADVNAEKGKATQLQSQVDTLTAQLQTAQDGLKAFEGVDVADLQGQITALQGKLTAQQETFAFDSALDGAIRDAKGRDVKAIRGMLDLDALRASKDRTTDISASLTALAKDKPWAFEGADSGSSVHVDTGTEHGAGGAAEDTAGVVAAFQALNPGLKLD
jgi:uncharacterized phage infection (PIP) family protein YhgE